MEPTFDELPRAVSELHEKLDLIEKLLIERLKAQNETSDLLNIRQASQLINLSVATIYSKVSRREIPVNKRGKKLYFSKAELSDWITSGRQKTTDELRDEALEKLYVFKRK